MQNDKIGIYCIENIQTGKKYIGQSIHIYERWSKHKGELRNGNHHNDYLQKAWDKYGEDGFKFYILECCSVDELDAKENYYINFYNAENRDLGYNLKAGGQYSGGKATPEMIRRQSEGLKKYYQENDDARKLHSEKALKQWSDPEIKEKITGENNGMYGRRHSEESKKKMSETKKSKHMISPHRNLTPVLCVELNTAFGCAAEAEKELGVRSGLILQVCYGNRKTTGGYHWKFII